MDPRIGRVIALMEDRLDERLSLGELAAAVRLSPSHMARLFAGQVGVPPARYLHQLRLARARILIERTSLDLAQIMACVGLRDPSHFSRDFRREHGVSPSQLRERSWGR
jgi:transcriptional regulator GlxA family with amidase domain